MSNMPRGAFMQVMEKYTKSLKAFISAQGFGHYSKPNGGIPKTDLDQSVQTSLGKADTALQNFTESDPTVPAWAKASSKPSYTASEVGLGNVGNFKAVSTVASQGLSDTEKANARTNIGGGTYSKPSGGIPKTDLASAVQTSLGKADSALQSETDPTVPAWAKASTKPSYTPSEVGLGNVGNFKAVSTVASQGLSDTEKANARTNIGAGTGNGTYSKPSDGIPKTDLASAVQTSLGKADSALQSHQTIKQDGVTGATVNRFGTCSTAAATAAKTVSITSGTFSLEAGARVSVKFTNTNTADTPTLNVNSKGAKNIYSKGSQITTGSNKSLLAGTVDFIYDGTQWHLIGNYIDTNTTYSAATTSAAGLMSAADKTKLDGIATGANNYSHPTTSGNKHIPSGGSSGQFLKWSADGTATWASDNNTYPSAYCSTAASTAAKAATCTGYALLSNSYLHVIITTANTSASALTLNVNGKGAKPIYINGSASSASNYTLPAGSYLVYYDGTNYYFRTDGKVTTTGIIDISGNIGKVKVTGSKGRAGCKTRVIRVGSWIPVTLEGSPSTPSGNMVWNDGSFLYYSNGSDQYKINIDTGVWQTKSWSGLTSFSGDYIWTDGDNIYYSNGTDQYVLDVETGKWSTKSWSGLTSFIGYYIWTDGDNIYYSKEANQYVLNKATSTWSAKSWSGLTSFIGYHVWTDGDNIYYSNGSANEYVLNKATSTWSAKSWTGLSLTSFMGNYIWTDGDNIYYSYGTYQYVLDKPTSTWSVVSFRYPSSLYGNCIWSDGDNIYYTKSGAKYILAQP